MTLNYLRIFPFIFLLQCAENESPSETNPSDENIDDMTNDDNSADSDELNADDESNSDTNENTIPDTNEPDTSEQNTNTPNQEDPVQGEAIETPYEYCFDAVDNNEDGFSDCADQDCIAALFTNTCNQPEQDNCPAHGIDESRRLDNASDELSIVTWNVRTYPSHQSETQNALVGAIINGGVDLVAMQEVAVVDAFDDLKTCEHIGTVFDPDARNQNGPPNHKLAFVYDTRKLIPVDVYTLNPGISNMTRPPLVASFEVASAERGGLILTFINLHLKSGASGPDRLKRRAEMQELMHALPDTQSRFSNHALFILGDFNEPASMDEDNLYDMFPNTFMRMTARIDSELIDPKGRPIIDHILLENAYLAQAFEIDRASIWRIDNDIQNYSTHVSDHLPIELQIKRIADTIDRGMTATPFSPENTDEACSDGLSNDLDRFIDCDDWDCRRNPNVTVCGEPYDPTTAEDSNESCSDGIDNDGDFHTDCADWDCSKNPAVHVC